MRQLRSLVDGRAQQLSGVAWITALCAFAVALVSAEARHDSPVFDELGHIVAGISHWRLASFELYRVNPPFVRAFATLPAAVCAPDIDWRSKDDNPLHRPEFLVARRWFGEQSRESMWWLRACRVLAVGFVVCGILVCCTWGLSLYGPAPAVATGALWTFCPNILGFGHLITPDVGAASLGALANYLFWKWLRESTWRRAAVVGVALGLAELTKMTWIVLFCLWPIMLLVWRWGQARSECSPGQFRQLAFALLLAVYVLNLGYAFEGSFTRLGDFQFVSQALSGNPVEEDKPIATGNRFANSWFGYIPVPVPKNYLLGIDRQKLDFELKLWSYLGGEWKRGGWWYYYLYALAIKVPLGTWALIGLATWCSLFRSNRSRVGAAFLGFGG